MAWALAPAESLSVGLSSLRTAEAALSSSREAAQRMLRPLSSGLVTALHLDQKLLLCNAYPSDSPITALRNGKDMLTDGGDVKGAIGFQECRYISSQVQKQDRLDFALRDVEVQGTFEVGDLPSTDAVLLLVLEKRENSPMLGFQSFAFPSAAGRKDAQLAVINTFKGNATAPRLQMEDYIAPIPAGKASKIVARRTEELNFNRVYSVEEGSYDASILDGAVDASGSLVQTKAASKVLKVSKATNYVLLRTQSGTSGESLVVFPDAPLPSGTAHVGAPALALLVALVAMFT